jgi:hypothetical protein
MYRSDPAVPENADVSPSWFVRTAGKSVINEAALKAAEEFLKRTVEEAAKNVPVAGIAVSIIAITREVREKQKELRERRELMEKVVAAYRKANATDDMSNLLKDFRKDDMRIAEFFQLISDFTKQLESFPAPAFGELPPAN